MNDQSAAAHRKSYTTQSYSLPAMDAAAGQLREAAEMIEQVQSKSTEEVQTLRSENSELLDDLRIQMTEKFQIMDRLTKAEESCKELCEEVAGHEAAEKEWKAELKAKQRTLESKMRATQLAATKRDQARVRAMCVRKLQALQHEHEEEIKTLQTRLRDNVRENEEKIETLQTRLGDNARKHEEALNDITGQLKTKIDFIVDQEEELRQSKRKFDEACSKSDAVVRRNARVVKVAEDLAASGERAGWKRLAVGLYDLQQAVRERSG